MAPIGMDDSSPFTLRLRGLRDDKSGKTVSERVLRGFLNNCLPGDNNIAGDAVRVIDAPGWAFVNMRSEADCAQLLKIAERHPLKINNPGYHQGGPLELTLTVERAEPGMLPPRHSVSFPGPRLQQVTVETLPAAAETMVPLSEVEAPQQRSSRPESPSQTEQNSVQQDWAERKASPEKDVAVQDGAAATPQKKRDRSRRIAKQRASVVYLQDFAKFDVDDDGAVVSLLLSAHRCQCNLGRTDMPGAYVVLPLQSFEEAQEMAKEMHLQHEDKLPQLFRKIDTDHSGTISLEEFKLMV